MRDYTREEVEAAIAKWATDAWTSDDDTFVNIDEYTEMSQYVEDCTTTVISYLDK